MKLLLLLLTCISLNCYGNLDYLERALHTLEKEQPTLTTIYQKVYFWHKIQQWLKLTLKCPLTEEEFDQLLIQAQPLFKESLDSGVDVAQHLYPNYPYKTIDVLYEEATTKAFVNMKPAAYPLEMENYAKHTTFQKKELTGKNLSHLKPYTAYAYVVTLEGKVFFSELQDFDWMKTEKSKELIAPNHALLADGQPVVAAGEIEILGKGPLKIYQVSSTSGHYCADVSTVDKMVRKLTAWGVPEHRIVTSVFLISSVPWKFIDQKVGS